MEVSSKGYRVVAKMISQGQTDPEVLVGAIHSKTVNNKMKKQAALVRNLN
jgi:hypothetical protein